MECSMYESKTLCQVILCRDPLPAGVLKATDLGKSAELS
jgi:hypothetical protein